MRATSLWLVGTSSCPGLPALAPDLTLRSKRANHWHGFKISRLLNQWYLRLGRNGLSSVPNLQNNKDALGRQLLPRSLGSFSRLPKEQSFVGPPLVRARSHATSCAWHTERGQPGAS
eukprot:scaffold1936_cov362-Pinguiococcus_pyrenoidosus.AAC.4